VFDQKLQKATFLTKRWLRAGKNLNLNYIVESSQFSTTAFSPQRLPDQLSFVGLERSFHDLFVATNNFVYHGYFEPMRAMLAVAISVINKTFGCPE
jgi:hypothetical protein